MRLTRYLRSLVRLLTNSTCLRILLSWKRSRRSLACILYFHKARSPSTKLPVIHRSEQTSDYFVLKLGKARMPTTKEWLLSNSGTDFPQESTFDRRANQKPGWKAAIRFRLQHLVESLGVFMPGATPSVLTLWHSDSPSVTPITDSSGSTSRRRGLAIPEFGLNPECALTLHPSSDLCRGWFVPHIPAPPTPGS